MIAVAALFERLAEPRLVLDSSPAPVAANTAWLARFGSSPTISGARAGHPLQLDQRHKQFIHSIAGNLRVGQSRQSPVVELDVKADTHDRGFWQRREWQIYASFIPGVACEPALITLRYDDVAARAPEVNEDRENAGVRSDAG
jgi:hypothetical protein